MNSEESIGIIELGNTNLKVSTICLGTMTWGEQNTQAEAFEQMDYSLDCGVNFFDAAEIYPSPCKKETYGETERIIGNWFNKKKKRDKVVFSSKVGLNSYTQKKNFSEKFITKQIYNILFDLLNSGKKNLKKTNDCIIIFFGFFILILQPVFLSLQSIYRSHKLYLEYIAIHFHEVKSKISHH